MAIDSAATLRASMTGKPHIAPIYDMDADGFFTMVQRAASSNRYELYLKLTDIDIDTISLDAIKATYVAAGYVFNYTTHTSDIAGATNEYNIVINWRDYS